MLPERPLSRGLRLPLALALLGLLVFFLESGAAEREPFRLCFGASYLLALAYLGRRLVAGELLHPAVCLVGPYLALLALGAFLFEALRARSLPPWAFNAIGAGHASLWVGFFLARSGPNAAPRERASIASRPAVELLLLGVLACLASSAALFALYGGIPLLAADPQAARLAILAGRGELALFLVGLGLLALAFLHDARARGASARSAHLLALLTFLIYLALGGRARALLFVLGYAGLELWLRPRRLRLAWLALTGTAALALFAAVGAWRRGGRLDAEASLSELAIGALALPAMVARLGERLEPGTLAAGPLDDLATLLPGEGRGANVALKYAVFENWRALPASAGVNPSLIGEGWIHLGSLGVVLEPFLLALASAGLWRRARASRGFLLPALYVSWITGMAAAISAGVGIRLTHLVQQLFWLALLAPFFLLRARGASGSKPVEALARVSDPA